jgi:hypothetical protein
MYCDIREEATKKEPSTVSLQLLSYNSSRKGVNLRTSEGVWAGVALRCGTEPQAQKQKNLTFRGPCIVIYSYHESPLDALFLRFI